MPRSALWALPIPKVETRGRTSFHDRFHRLLLGFLSTKTSVVRGVPVLDRKSSSIFAQLCICHNERQVGFDNRHNFNWLRFIVWVKMGCSVFFDYAGRHIEYAWSAWVDSPTNTLGTHMATGNHSMRSALSSGNPISSAVVLLRARSSPLPISSKFRVHPRPLALPTYKHMTLLPRLESSLGNSENPRSCPIRNCRTPRHQ